ncbi:PA2778 family cysteine peptidase [Thiovibrio sp. JS02]
MSSPLSTIGANRRGKPRFFQAGSRLIAGLLFFLLAVLSAGCGLLPGGRLPRVPEGPESALVAGVPFFPQDELQCGPAALAMALSWSGIAVSPADLSGQVYSPGLKGSLQSALVGAARRHGRVAYPIAGGEALLAEVAAGRPVIVLMNLAFSWYPKWHYGVVLGYDQQRHQIILHSGLTANERLSARVFMNIWRRGGFWGLLVLPPEQLPARAREEDWLAAVAPLEHLRQWQAAQSGYAAALGRWPASFAAWMGLGNSRYGLHDLAGAEEAFLQASRLQPHNGMAFNNLAQVLAEQGKRAEALAAAQRAVELGGPLLDGFRRTLEEIKAKAFP